MLRDLAWEVREYSGRDGWRENHRQAAYRGADP